MSVPTSSTTATWLTLAHRPDPSLARASAHDSLGRRAGIASGKRRRTRTTATSVVSTCDITHPAASA
jgi:hypothetical protein